MEKRKPGRPPKFKKTTIMSVRIDTDDYDKMPVKKSQFLQDAVDEKLKREGLK